MKRPKILLINPDPNPYVATSSIDFGAPMSILAIGSYLKYHGIDVGIIDARLYKGNDILLKIEDKIGSASLVGFSVMTAQIKEALRLSKYIKTGYKEKKIVWGGVHPTLFPQQTLTSLFVDFIVIGEGELVALKLIHTLESKGSPSDFLKIDGLGFKDSGEIVINKRHKLMNMDDIPFQSFELLEVEKYINTQYPFIGLKRELLVQTSRGCPHRCAFCINYLQRDYNVWRHKSAKLVLDEIRELKHRYKLDAISFRDENMFVKREHASAIIDGLDSLRINWFANARADYFNEINISEKLLKKTKDSGVGYLGIGAESGSQRILNLMCKDITINNILFSAEQLNKYNITGSFSFIIGIPSETKTEMKYTVDLMKKIKKICPHSIFSGPQILRPYPGGSLYNLCIENGYRSPQSLEEWAQEELRKFGELSTRNYPWFKYPSFIMALSTYVSAALNYNYMKNLDFKRKIYSSIAYLRLKFNFWFFPYEYFLAIRVAKYFYIFKKRLLGLFKHKSRKNNVWDMWNYQ